MSLLIPTNIDPRRLFATVLLVAGLGVGTFGAYDYVQQTDALDDAIAVDATVVDTEIEQVSTRRNIEYRPVITYTYTYEGTAYTANEYYASMAEPGFDTEAGAREVLEAYPTDTTVTAYITPDAPGTAFLTREQSGEPLKWIGLGGITALVGLYGWAKALLG